MTARPNAVALAAKKPLDRTKGNIGAVQLIHHDR